MPTLTEALGPEEDWSGLKDAKVRRKLQNRLNVRAHRRRKAMLSKTKTQTATHNSTDVAEQHHPSESQEHKIQRDTGSLLVEFSKLQLQERDCTSRDQAIAFPLTLDHLIPLVHYNFIRGVLTNMAILGLQESFPPECSRFWTGMTLFPAPSTIPESLQQTELQRSTPHEPWIDLIPDKQIRDNAILAAGSFTRQDVEIAVAGSIDGRSNMLELNGVIAWGDPWRPEAWEFTEGFIKEFPFLVKGCWRMLESTNRWRALRDEEPLVLEL
ncbi:hypothetical protein F5Y11DRAFT_317759 [Daldinia sp. FL1419]|nr:hypothetical protein F5Y11DRAFT_317759 [Daldinia sp. FL1419]